MPLLKDNKKYSSRVRNEEAPKLYNLETGRHLDGIDDSFCGLDEDDDPFS